MAPVKTQRRLRGCYSSLAGQRCKLIAAMGSCMRFFLISVYMLHVHAQRILSKLQAVAKGALRTYKVVS
jgi:hypothetical protein